MYNRAYIGGTFDLLHPGHINLFKKAKEIADEVVVSLNRDDFVRRYKGNAPLMSLKERTEIVKACRYVDKVVVNVGDENSKPAILKAKADVIIHGDDWVGASLMKQMGFDKKWLKDNKISLHYFPYTKGVSSSGIKERFARLIKTHH